MKEVLAIRAVGQQDYDDAVSALAKARPACWREGRGRGRPRQPRLHPVKAPISGRIGRSAVTVGALVSAYQPAPLAVVQQLDPIYVDVTQASADILRLTRNVQSGS